MLSWPDQALQLAGMLEANRLESLELKSHPVRPDNSHLWGPALTRSLWLHVQMFADLSTYRMLDLHDTLDEMDSDDHRDLFHLIGILPSLESFSITTRHTNLLEKLAGSIENWKIHHFKRPCE